MAHDAVDVHAEAGEDLVVVAGFHEGVGEADPLDEAGRA